MPRKPQADANKHKTFPSLAYKKNTVNIEDGLRGNRLDFGNKLYDRVHKMFYTPALKKAVVAYRSRYA